MTKTKHPATSLGLQGAIVVLVGFFLDKFGVHISENELINIISAIFILSGAVMSFYGRWRAKHMLKK